MATANPPAPPEAPRATLDSSCNPLAVAAAGFIGEHLVFESETILDLTINKFGESTSLAEAALVPLRMRAFDHAGALLWGYFLHTAGPKLLKESGSALAPLDVGAYLAEVASVYDIATRAAVWDLCEDGEEEASSEEVSEV